jgi:hypothetical protein
MVDHTNVNDAAFLGDWILNTDYLRDLNSHEQAIRDTMLDLFGSDAIVFDGLMLSDGTNPDSVQVSAGRGRDNLKYHVLLAALVDNIPFVDATGGYNYVAIRHKWAYSGADASAKIGTAYNRIRSDDYEIEVANAIHAEAAGWINLGRAHKAGGIWYYEFNYPYRSYGSAAIPFHMDFAYPGALPGVNTFMYRHGINADIIPVPFDFRASKYILNIGTGVAGNVVIQLMQNGAVIMSATLAVGLGVFQSGIIAFQSIVDYAQNDLIQVQINDTAGGMADAYVDIIGNAYKRS